MANDRRPQTGYTPNRSHAYKPRPSPYIPRPPPASRNDPSVMSYEEIGRAIGVSRKRVEQIANAALAKLRRLDPKAMEALREAWLEPSSHCVSGLAGAQDFAPAGLWVAAETRSVARRPASRQAVSDCARAWAAYAGEADGAPPSVEDETAADAWAEGVMARLEAGARLRDALIEVLDEAEAA